MLLLHHLQMVGMGVGAGEAPLLPGAPLRALLLPRLRVALRLVLLVLAEHWALLGTLCHITT